MEKRDRGVRKLFLNENVRGALKTAVNEGRNKVDSMRSYLETLLQLFIYKSSPFQNVLRVCKHHLFHQVLTVL